ncbi:MAG TPA: ion channel [Candidatus Sulfotelmatobacter sp.]|nr:ion channel [Candidatus Sulfotelmatobacter sp.]
MHDSYALRSRETSLRAQMGEFWSGDIGLTLLTLSLAALVFVITPLREAGLTSRAALDFIIMVLMVYGAVVVKQNRVDTLLVIAFIFVTGVLLATGRLHPTPLLHQIGCVLTTITLLLYIRIVLLVMFRTGPITWNRVQGGICAYLLVGMVWASAFQIVEQSHPGSFHFVNAPADFDQLISKLTYYSFCTLTTLGSDVSPISPIARSLTVAEATVGQLFPAIFIGALVAMAMQSRTKP